jgi:hypothetical protein
VRLDAALLDLLRSVDNENLAADLIDQDGGRNRQLGSRRAVHSEAG